MRKKALQNIRSIVIKVGTSILTRGGRFDRVLVGHLADEISGFLKRGVRVYVVSSGAIGSGMTLLKLKSRPLSMQGLQAAAAVGQRYLMQCYEQAFEKNGYRTAQVLLTWDDLAAGTRFQNARRTLKQIQAWKCVPIINENDTVATDEIRFGDNDRLSSLLSILVQADVQVILSDTDGLRGPQGRISVVPRMDNALYSLVRDGRKKFTVGGMRAKLKAVEMSVNSGVPVIVADGRKRRVLSRLFAGEDLGTLFVPQVRKRHARRNWVNYFLSHVRRSR